MTAAARRLEAVPRLRGIDHVTIVTRDHDAARRFYAQALRPLGFAVVFHWPDRGRACLGLPDEKSSLWLVQSGEPGRVALSLAAPDGSTVDAFHAAAVAAGGRSVSPPSFRPEFTPSTYAAEIADPEGNRIEAICHRATRVQTHAEHAAA
jgi:catechol 2,3-dioxygenase-like lactoylglutathione lyase family enzyme